MKIKVYNNENIKLQGLSYYSDCYKYWDLNLCEESFSDEYFKLIPNVNKSFLKPRFHNENLPMALIDFDLYQNNFENYYNKLSSAVRRDIKVAEKSNFYFKEYNFNHHIQDFSEINFSQKKIKNNINSWYLRSTDQFKETHSGYRHKWEDDLHYSQWYGVFKYFKHYKQEGIVTNEKLFAYCKLAVEGELAVIHLIWGHGNFLNKGLMFYLITNIVKEAMKNSNIGYLVYSSWLQFPKWKSRMLFKPQNFTVLL